jgi:dienelactone hydrolase
MMTQFRLSGFFLAVALATAGPRVEKTINRDWVFQYFPAGEPDLRTSQSGFDDSHWQAIALPHTWSTYETTGDLHPFIKAANEKEDTYWWYGWGWYRKRLLIGKEYAGRTVSLEFDGVQKYSKVWVNGVAAGEHRGGYTSFSVDATKLIRFGEENVIAVQVSNRRDDNFRRIPPMTAGNFDVYGGIYRDVRVVIRDRLAIPYQGSSEHEGGTFVTTPQVSADRGTVDVRTWVRNDYPQPKDCTLVTKVLDADGRVVLTTTSRQMIAMGATAEFHQDLGAVTKPRLWSPESPYLYRVTTEVLDGARVTDTYGSPLGFRWFSWDHAARRLHLNGKLTLLRGINRHQEYPWLGDAMPKWMHLTDLEDMRYGMGLNFQRTVHYPNDPYVYDQCDRLGFLLIEELPNIKDITFGKDVQRTNIKEAIRRDRNHPSIIFWSIGNETNQPADSKWAHEEDTSRIIYLRRGDNGGDFVQLTDKDLPIENLLRCTMRGWYSQDDRDFGPETRNPSSGQITGTEWWQHESCVRGAKLTEDNVVVWLYADHGADRKYVNSPLLYVNPKGWKDAYRFPKYVYYLWQANYTTKPMAFVEPHYWREQYLGQKKAFVVDSNCDEVTLKVNGRSVGTQRPTAANNHSVVFEGVTVERGILTVEGRHGAERAEYSVTMAGKPARLTLNASAKQIIADRAGIAVLSTDIVDAKGVHVYGASPTLTWTVTGPGRLAGPAVYESDTNKKGALEGTLYIDAPVANALRSTAVPGTIRVKVSAPGLDSAEVEIPSVAPADDRIAGIVEPVVSDEGRGKVTRLPSFRPVLAAAKPASKTMVAEIDRDYDFAGGDLRAQLDRFVRERNPKLDTKSAAYTKFLDRLVQIVTERNGHLVRDDYNFNARAYSSAAEEQPDKRAQIRSALFVPKQLPALDSQDYGQVEAAPGVVADRVSYATDYGLRVPAIVYRPAQRPAAKMPGLIVVNGHGGDKYSWYAFYAGILYARMGAVVLTYDPIGEGERNAQRKNGTRQHDRNVEPEEMGRRMGGLMMTDVMQATSYLSQRADVDAKRIAAMGYSMGSFVLGLACAAEPRLSACVLTGGGNLDGEGGYWDSSSKKMCQAIPYQAMKFLGDRGLELYRLHPSTLAWNGSADDVVAMPKAGPAFFEDMKRRLGAKAFDYGFTEGGGHRPYFVTKPAAEWLNNHLHFPMWKQDGETHISEWAAKNHVAMDTLYATELREGGTMAYGTEIPGVAHDVLNALPPEKWQAEKDKYIYETWLHEARARLK